MISYATIGSGWIVDSMIDGFTLNETATEENAELTAVYSRTAEKGRSFAAKHQVKKIYTSLDDLAADDTIEAVYIASPNALHVPQSRKMLESGKHVLCEKPICTAPEELDILMNLAQRKNLVYMEAIMGRYLPERTILQEAISRIGRICHVRIDFSQRSSRYDSILAGHHENVFDPAMAGGALMDLGIYCVYPALDFFGVPQDVLGYASFLPTGADGSGGAILRYTDFHVELTYAKTGQDRIGSEIIGDEGTIRIPSISQLTDMTLVHKDGSTETLSGAKEKATLMSYEAAAFCRYIRQPDLRSTELAASMALGLQVHRCMEVIRNRAGIHFPMN